MKSTEQFIYILTESPGDNSQYRNGPQVTFCLFDCLFESLCEHSLVACIPSSIWLATVVILFSSYLGSRVDEASWV